MYGSRKVLQGAGAAGSNAIEEVISSGDVRAGGSALSSFSINITAASGQTGDLVVVATSFTQNSPSTLSFSGSIQSTNLVTSVTSGLGTGGVVIYTFRLTADTPTVTMSANAGGDGSGGVNLFNYHILRSGPALRADDTFGSEVEVLGSTQVEPNPDGNSMADPAFGTVVGYYTCATMFGKEYASGNVSAPTGFTNLQFQGDSYSGSQATQASSVMLPDAANYAEPLLSGAYGINDTLTHSYWNFYGVPIILD